MPNLKVRFAYPRVVSHSLHYKIDEATGESVPFIHTSNTPVACVAIAVDEDTQEILYAVSQLNPLDTYDKALGREKALERLSAPKEWKKSFSIPLNGVTHRWTITGMVFNDIANRCAQDYAGGKRNRRNLPVATFSQQTYKAVKAWLKRNNDYANPNATLSSESIEVNTIVVDESYRAETAFEVGASL